MVETSFPGTVYAVQYSFNVVPNRCFRRIATVTIVGALAAAFMLRSLLLMPAYSRYRVKPMPTSI